MQTEPDHSQRSPAEWSGARLLVEKWLARRCGSESVMNFVGGVVFLVFGLAALVVTSSLMSAAVLFLLVGVNAIFIFCGFGVSLLRPVLFGILCTFFLLLSVVHAYKTRWDSDSAAKVDFETSTSTLKSMALEFMSAGPILFILSAQDFSRYVRLARLDCPHVSALLLWLYDKGGRAGFAEICLAFPGLNAVRVLPQLRDLPGIHWWREEGEISISETLRRILAEVLGREPKTPPSFHSSAHNRQQSEQRMPEVGDDIYSWYAALNLPPFATLQQVKARFRALAKIHHPDARSVDRATGEVPNDERMKRINEAYHNILKNSQRQAGFAPD
jgi:DnaJ-domain-containing protein 1